MGIDLKEALRAHELYQSIYNRHAAGCCLHVVLDDWNVGDEFVKGGASNVDPTHPDCVALAEILPRMSPTQRLKLGHGGYDKVYWIEKERQRRAEEERAQHPERPDQNGDGRQDP